jgi:WD40 repeat protein
LRAADLEKIKADFPDYPYPNLFRTIEVSVEQLDATTRERYLALAVLLDSMAAHPAIQQTLWRTDEGEAAETAEKLIELSLAQREADGLSIRLHGLQLDYVRAKNPDREALALIHDAVRLGSNVISSDPDQFSSSVAGRLVAHEDQPGVHAFTSRLREQPPKPWLRLITPTLTPPGGPLLLMIKGAKPRPSALDLGGLSVLAVSQSEIISAAFDENELAVWDLESGQPLRTLNGHSGRVVALAVTADGKQAISASLDETIRVWDLKAADAVRTIACKATSLAIAPDGTRFVAGSEDGALRMFVTESGEVAQELAGCDSRVDRVAFADDRHVLACAGRKTFVWNLRGSPSPRVLADFGAPMAVLPGTGRVASAKDKTLTVWDIESGATVFSTTRDSFGYDQVAALPDGRSFIYACLMDVLEVVDAATGQVRLKIPNIAGLVAFLAVAPDGRRVVTAVNSGEIRVWDLGGRVPARTAAGHSRMVRSVAVTNGGLYAASMALDCSVIWDLDEGNVAYVLDTAWCSNPFVESYLSRIPGPWNRREALLPGGAPIAAVGGNKLQIRNLDTEEVQSPELVAHDDVIEIVRATPDGQRVVTGSLEGVGRIWSLPEGKEIASLHGHSGAITDLVIDLQRRRVVTASMDNSLKVWDLDTGRLQRTLEGHTGSISGVARFPAREFVVSTSYDQTVRVWDLASGEPVASFTAESMPMCCAAAPDNVTIVAGDVSGSVHILRLEGAPEVPSEAAYGWSSEPHRPEIGEAYTQAGTLCHIHKEFARAEQLYKLALEARIFLLGLADPVVAASFNYLGNLYAEQKRYQEAEPLLLQGLAIYVRTLGADHLNVATNLQNIGFVYVYQARWVEAEACYRSSIAILESNPAADRSMLANGLDNLAEVLRQSGRASEAGAYEERASAARQA